MRLSQPFRKLAIPVGIVVWLAALGFGFHRLASYSLKSGAPPEERSPEWPDGLPLARAADHDTLIVTLHPECPCSRATLSELERIANHVPGLRLYAVFESYDTLPEPIETSGLWQQAQSIPGMTTVKDAGGAIAAKLGNKTSGEVRLFSPQGQLLFSGGVTASRGHAGENPASDAVIALATGQSSSPQFKVPTFGCALDS